MSFPSIKFRENMKRGHVMVLLDGKEVFSASEYLISAKWARAQYSLSDSELMEMYRDYKEDYESQK